MAAIRQANHCRQSTTTDASTNCRPYNKASATCVSSTSNRLKLELFTTEMVQIAGSFNPQPLPAYPPPPPLPMSSGYGGAPAPYPVADHRYPPAAGMNPMMEPGWKTDALQPRPQPPILAQQQPTHCPPALFVTPQSPPPPILVPARGGGYKTWVIYWCVIQSNQSISLQCHHPSATSTGPGPSRVATQGTSQIGAIPAREELPKQST